MINFIVQYQWEFFVGAEILSWGSLVIFLLLRYAFKRPALSIGFLLLFILVTVFEALLAWIVYQQTGEIDTFQVVIVLFIVYACTFGISDFRKLDRYIKKKVGQWRGENLLTEKDLRIMKQEQDPRFQARQYRRWWYGHTAVFIIGHYIMWIYFGSHDRPLIDYLTDLSWWGEEDIEATPFREEAVYQISMIWGIVFIIDTIISWSYTLFPDKRKVQEE